MKLYGYRNGRTLRALWALEEAGAQYEYVEVDVLRGAGREPWFLEINPGGKVPVLDDDGMIITESAAICIHIADKFPKSRLMPPAGTTERTECYKWISFVLTELDAPLWTIARLGRATTRCIFLMRWVPTFAGTTAKGAGTMGSAARDDGQGQRA